MLTAPLAMAQSNVTVYGLVDMGLSYESSNTNSAISSRTGLDSGLQSGSRLGFRGTEDLGNGLRAGFVIEYGINPDLNETLGTGGGATNRQSFLSLAGDFGTVAAGRQYTPQFGLVSRLDPFGTGTAGAATNIYTWDARLDNTLAYVSPNFSGLTVTVAHSFNAAGTEVRKNGTAAVAATNAVADLVTGVVTPGTAAVAATNNTKVWAISPRYSNGPIDAQINYHRIKSDASGATATKVWDLGGSYDLGAVKPVAIYGTRKTGSTQDMRYWLVGATAPVGEAGLVRVSYVANKDKIADTKANQWAIGYDHKLSGRTNLYSAIANRGQDFTGYENRITVGLRHSF